MTSTLKNPTITLHRGFESKGVYVYSPFVNKLEARFRFAGLSYLTDCGSVLKAPKGKVPYIGISNPDEPHTPPKFLGDSTLIIAKLVEDGVIKDMNVRLTPAEQAHDLALRALLEEKLNFYQGYERWHENYYTMRTGVLHSMPYPAQVIVGLLAYRKTTTMLYNQGTMRHTGEEINRFKRQIWESINALLVESKQKIQSSTVPFWLCRNTAGPSEADATLYGYITSNLVCEAAPTSMALIKSFPAIMDYAKRIHDAYFPDYLFPEK